MLHKMEKLIPVLNTVLRSLFSFFLGPFSLFLFLFGAPFSKREACPIQRDHPLPFPVFVEGSKLAFWPCWCEDCRWVDWLTYSGRTATVGWEQIEAEWENSDRRKGSGTVFHLARVLSQGREHK